MNQFQTWREGAFIDPLDATVPLERGFRAAVQGWMKRGLRLIPKVVSDALNANVEMSWTGVRRASDLTAQLYTIRLPNNEYVFGCVLARIECSSTAKAQRNVARVLRIGGQCIVLASTTRIYRASGLRSVQRS